MAIKSFKDSLLSEVNELFTERKEEESKDLGKKEVSITPPENDTDQRKGMALLLRHEPNKSKDKESDEQL